jgi:hypothetical protein
MPSLLRQLSVSTRLLSTFRQPLFRPPTSKQKTLRFYLDIFMSDVRPGRQLALSPDAPPAKVSFREADFFTFSVPKDELFDLVYDYTSAAPKVITLSYRGC